MKFTLRDIERIRAVAEKACREANRLRKSKFKDAAVNWADFRVVDVEQVILVQIEEASPSGANDVRLYIWEQLEKAGYGPEGVEVQLEW